MSKLAFILAAIFLAASAQAQTGPKDWVADSLNKTIVVTKDRTYTIRGSGTTVINERGMRNDPRPLRRGEVRWDYGPGYRNDEAAQSGCYCSNPGKINAQNLRPIRSR